MNKIVKYLLYFVVALAVIGGISYFSFMNAPKASSEGKKVEHTISANNLFQEFEADETASNKKYIGKIVEVAGTIGDITEDENGATVILLEAGEDGMGGVLCTLEPSQKETATTLDFGQSVKIKGVCTGMLMEVVVNKGILVK